MSGDNSRLGWCYGDLGVGAILHRLAHRAQDNAQLATSKDILMHCVARPVNASHIMDAGLCHGAVGVAHIYNRLFQWTAEPQYRDAAKLWYSSALQLRQSGLGICGYFAWRPETNPPYDPDPSFLAGAAGIGLGLLAAISDVAPEWDRRLLLSGISARNVLARPSPSRF